MHVPYGFFDYAPKRSTTFGIPALGDFMKWSKIQKPVSGLLLRISSDIVAQLEFSATVQIKQTSRNATPA